MSEFCKESAQPRNWREQDSAVDFKFEISDFKSAGQRDFSARRNFNVSRSGLRPPSRARCKERQHSFVVRVQALGDVVGDGKRGAVELVAKPASL